MRPLTRLLSLLTSPLIAIFTAIVRHRAASRTAGMGPRVGGGGGDGHDSWFVGRPLSISHPTSTRPLLPQHGSGCHFTGRFTRPDHHFSKEASFVKTRELCEILRCTQPHHPDRPFLRQPEHGGRRRSGGRDGLLTPRRALKRLGLNGRAFHGEGPVEAQRQRMGPVTSRCARRL